MMGFAQSCPTRYDVCGNVFMRSLLLQSSVILAQAKLNCKSGIIPEGTTITF